MINGSAPNPQAISLPVNGQAAVSVPVLPAQAIPTPATEPVGSPSECLLLKNMFDPATEVCGFLALFVASSCNILMFEVFMQMDPDFDMDIKEDVEEECSKYGRVRHAHVDK
jgi:RNA-binding protein 39